jgi:hypothetical protein
MLLVGIDWAQAEHAACLMDAAGAVRRRLRVPHSAAGLQRPRAAVAEQRPEAETVLVAVERAHGQLVDALLTAGYTVSALNPKAVERYRARTRTAEAKSDPADAELLARILLTDRARYRPLRPSSPQVAALRALARDDGQASRDERRLLNRLRHDLLEVFPQALEAFPRLADGIALAFLARWPTAAAARGLGREQLERFFRECQHGWPARAAARVRAALAAEGSAAGLRATASTSAGWRWRAGTSSSPTPRAGPCRWSIPAARRSCARSGSAGRPWPSPPAAPGPAPGAAAVGRGEERGTGAPRRLPVRRRAIGVRRGTRGERAETPPVAAGESGTGRDVARRRRDRTIGVAARSRHDAGW